MAISETRARELVNTYLKTDYLKWHVRETEVVMRALAGHFSEDEELWGLTGLLHDLDMDEIGTDYDMHGKRTCEMLAGEDAPAEMLQAIRAHCENLGFLGVKRESRLDYALAAAENLTGFLVACALVQPDKKLATVQIDSVVKKLKKKDFARKVNREFIADIENTGMTQEQLIDIGLKAMQEIAGEIGL
ncbi:MAG TPA: HD domain-containing protein [bacterium]|nr:HD domain-containing protein [bacterium]